MMKKLLTLTLCLIMIFSLTTPVFAQDHSVTIIESKIYSTEQGVREEGSYSYKGKIYTYVLDRGKDGSFKNVVLEKESNTTEVYTYDKKNRKLYLNGTTLVSETKVTKTKIDKPKNNSITIMGYSSASHFIENGDTFFYMITIAAVASALAADIPSPYSKALAIASVYVAGYAGINTTWWTKDYWRYYDYTSGGYYYPYMDDITCYAYWDSQRTNCYDTEYWQEYAPLP
ncbi:MAG: hypothetical protein QHH10_05665 [Peptococcaceae bacterium]|nr:hypothetical protein [Peptococcaceae bacterium]MDH7524788.1 hypothetical protein [Peptococcaceae bacterium]